jgi:hypothetical protein
MIASRKSAAVIAGTTCQNALLSYRYAPSRMASDRGGAALTTRPTTARAKTPAPIWMK